MHPSVVTGKFSPKIQLVVVQSTPFCNLDCSYCYLPSRQLKSRMSLSVVEAVFRRIFESGWADERLTVVWHAGEPLVLSASYYEEAFKKIESLKPDRVYITHSFQTNATIVSDEIIGLIKKYDVKIGVSLDGPKHIHDKHRVDRNKKGTFDRAIAGTRRFMGSGIDVSAICVLTDYSLDFSTEIFEFFVDEGIQRVAFNVEEVEGVNANSSLSKASTYDRYWNFMARFWNQSIRTKKIAVLRELEEAISGILRPENIDISNSLTEPFSILNVDVEGNFGTYSPEFLGFTHQKYGNFCFGNLKTQSLEDALVHPNFLALEADIQAGVANCKANCDYFSVCGGGAPANKLWENEDLTSSETFFCLLTKKLPADLSMQLLKSVGSKGFIGMRAKDGDLSDLIIRPFS